MRRKSAKFSSVSIQSWLCRTAAFCRQTFYNFVTKVVSPTNDEKNNTLWRDRKDHSMSVPLWFKNKARSCNKDITGAVDFTVNAKN